MIAREINPTETYPWITKRRNITLIVLSFLLILSITSFLLCYRHYRETAKHAFLNDRQSANLHALLVETYLHDIVSTMEAYANRPLLMQAVSQKNWGQAKQHLLNLIRLNPNIDSVVITDVKGTLWFAQPHRPDVLEKNFAHRDWYRGVSRQWKPYISEAVLRVTGEKDTAIHIAVPIFDKTGAVVGVLLNAQRAVEMGKIFRRAPLEQGLFIAITDRQGVIIYSSRYAYEKALVRYPFHKAVKDGMAGGVQTVAVSDPSADGAIRCISSATVKDVGWKIFVGRDQNSIWSASSGYFIQTILICFLLFLVITFFLFYIRKEVMTQTEIEKLRNENELMASETRFRELFEHMNSGVAIYEAVNNGEDFVISEMNTAAKKITGVSGGFAGKSVRDVFPSVEAFGLFKIFQQVWYTGVAAFHPNALYQDKQLTFWAENHVYKLPSGQVVVIFDDVTERKKTEAFLKESERKYRLLFDEMISGCAVHEIICDQNGKPVDYRFLSVNAAFGKMTGLNAADIIGRTALEVLPEIEPIWIERYGHVALTREPQQFVNYFNSLKKYFGVRAFSPEAGKFATVISDVTERIQAEEDRKRFQEELEKRVALRTEELSAKTAELERINRVFVDRELRMRELKKRMAEMEKKMTSDQRRATSDEGKPL